MSSRPVAGSGCNCGKTVGVARSTGSWEEGICGRGHLWLGRGSRVEEGFVGSGVEVQGKGRRPRRLSSTPSLASLPGARRFPAIELAAAAAPDANAAAEEVAKRNTDCVYFLASPLTCKKGSDCEFRHSDTALMNPRDCWYWLNGNCLNPRCGFRHPPLDVFNGTTGNGLTVATSHQMPKAANAKVSGPNVKKQDVPCYFFQIDSCMKGDMCPFLHGSQSAFPSVNPPQPSKLTAADEPETRINGPLQKCQNKQNVPQPHTQNPADQLVAAERSVKVEVAPCQRTSKKKSALSANNIVDEFADPEASDSPLSNENGGDRQFSYPEDDFQNCEDADEFLGESSPGFDVLVDNDDENSDYFHNEDEMGVDSGHSGRLTSSLNVFDLNGLSDPDRLVVYDRDFGNYADYDQYMHSYYRYDLSNYTLSEGITDGLKGDRRGISSLESHETISGSDLRHRLSRKRRAYGHRSARSPDRLSNYLSRGKFLAGEHRYGIHPYRDQKKFSLNRSISSRLRGRLKLPEISDPENGDYLHHNGENEGQRQLGRFSFNQVAFANQRRHRHERTRKDLASDCRRTSSFARNTNGVYTKHENVGGQQRLESSVSFEGPKPLSILLKIKREAASANNKGSLSSEDDSQRQKVDSVSDEKDFTRKAKMEAFSIEREETICEGQLPDQKEDAYSLKEGLLSDAMAGDQEYEPYDGDEEYEYDPTEEGGRIGDYHNASPGDVYIDDDDDGYDGE